LDTGREVSCLLYRLRKNDNSPNNDSWASVEIRAPREIGERSAPNNDSWASVEIRAPRKIGERSAP